MQSATIDPVACWSTQDVTAKERLDYWAATLSSAMVPLYVAGADATSFDSSMSVGLHGPIALVRQNGAAHQCGRTNRELARSSEHSFNLLISLDQPFAMEHRGDHRIRAGDVVMADSEVPMGLDIRKRYEFVNLAMPPDWLKTWVPNPQWLVGRSLLDHSRWGPALSSYLAMLAPQVGAHLPVSGEAVASHVGGLLALITEDIRGGTAKLSKASASLQQRAVDCIVQRCQEPALMAPDVATSIGVSVRTLHRTLAMNGTSFSAVLMKARVDAATRMLESPLFRRLTVGEIGRRAGFSDASHFSRTIRSVCGTTPQQLRVRRSGNPLSQEQFTQKL